MYVKLLLTYMCLIVSSLAYAKTISLKEGTVHFSAVGRPAMLKINGDGQIQGKALLEQKFVSAEFDLDLQKISTGIELRDEHMKNKYLEVGKYPNAILKIKDLLWADSDASLKPLPFNGELTLHGETQKVTGTFTPKKNGKILNISAQFDINIKDYKIDIPSYMGIKVADIVKLEVDLKLEN